MSAAPEAGKANDAVVRLLAEALALPVREIEIVSGHSSRDKIVELAGLTSSQLNGAEIERRLAAASNSGKESA